MSIGFPPAGLPDDKTTEARLAEMLGGEMAPYWLSAIIESAEDAVISKTLEGVITSWNKGAERIFGYTAAEAVGQPVTILIPTDHLDEEPAILARLRAGERVEHYETVRRRKDGTLIDIALTVSPIRGPQGRIIGASKIARDITGRKRAELALRQSEQELSDFFENAVVGLHWVGPDGTILRANRAEMEMLGYAPEEYLGHHIAEFHADHAAILDILQRLQAGEMLHEYEARLRCKDGSIRHVLIDSSVRWEKGEFIHTRCFTRDVTERKKAEKELLERARLSALGADVGVALTQTNALPEMLHACAEALVRHLDAAFARVWTLNEEEQVLELQASAGLYTHLDGPHSRVPVGQYKIGLIAEERVPHMTNDVPHDPRVSDHEWAAREGMVAFAGYPLIVAERLVGVMGLFARHPLNEATLQAMSSVANGIALGIERKRAEEKLREQAEVIETVNRVGQTLAAELDQHKLVQAVTDAATEIAGAHFGSFFYNVLDERGASYMLYTLSGVPGEAFAHFPMPRNTDIFAPTFNGEGTVLIADVKKDPRYGKNSPYYGMPEGHLPVTSYLAVPVISRSGEVLGGLFFGHPEEGVFTERAARIVEGLAAQTAVAMDNARLYETAQRARAEAEQTAQEKERLYREAQESSRLKDEFLATVSHELRTPLTAILGWAHMLRTGQFGDDSALKAIETIERNARSQSQLIDDLLDVSRIITGKLRIDVRPVDPNTFIESAVEAVRPAAEAKGVRVQRIMDTGVATVSGDPVRLQQVVWNLLSNAIKFTPRGGRVQVRLERVNSHVEISVSDNGAGIAPEFLPYVFDRFRQADQRTTRQHGGLGLGLAIVRHLVELHGGTVRAESPGEGQGSTFMVLLPVAPVYRSINKEERVHSAARDTLPSYGCPDRLDGLRVLAVDDEADTRELLKAGLGQCGAEVTAVGSAAEALEAMVAAVPDLLISDIGMPGEDGYELIRRVRALTVEGGGKVPAIALTAYARVEDRMQALRAGYQMHVPKPVELAELVAVAASLMRRDN
jgi:PAS domain S-box-containing protein